jgi:hypothetical protein
MTKCIGAPTDAVEKELIAKPGKKKFVFAGKKNKKDKRFNPFEKK